MQNNRSLFPPLFRPVASGGGGSGQTIQVPELPEAVLSEKDKIYQYTGSTTEELINGYFYKCVEKTETVDNVITVTYEWKNIPVMEVASGGEFTIPFSTTPTEVGTYMDGKKAYIQSFSSVTVSSQNVTLLTNTNINRVIGCFGIIKPVFGGDTHTIGTYTGASAWSSVVLGNNGVVKLVVGSDFTGNVADITILYTLN